MRRAGSPTAIARPAEDGGAVEVLRLVAEEADGALLLGQRGHPAALERQLDGARRQRLAVAEHGGEGDVGEPRHRPRLGAVEVELLVVVEDELGGGRRRYGSRERGQQREDGQGGGAATASRRAAICSGAHHGVGRCSAPPVTGSTPRRHG